MIGRVLIDHFFDIVKDTCVRFELWPSKIFAAKGGRTSDIWPSKARACIVAELRRTVGRARKGVAGDAKHVIFPNGLDLDQFDPISYPTIGKMLGMHHTSILRLHQKSCERPSRDAPANAI